jgi:hypothetical protein
MFFDECIVLKEIQKLQMLTCLYIYACSSAVADTRIFMNHHMNKQKY